MMNLFDKMSIELEIALIAAVASILMIILLTLCLVCRPDEKKVERTVRSNSFNFSSQPLPASVSVNIESFTMSRSFSVYMRSESPRPEPRNLQSYVNPAFSDDFIDHLYHLFPTRKTKALMTITLLQLFKISFPHYPSPTAQNQKGGQ